MLQLAETGGKITANLTERMSLTELIEKHDNKLVPTPEPLGGTFHLGIADCLQKITLVKDL
jgi:hypothetical protein